MKTTLPLSVLAAGLLLLPLHAEVKLPAIFGDHMVLQEGKTLPVWGTAAAGEKVTVTIDADSATTTAGADGAWRVDLKPLPISATATTLTVAGTNTVTFQDVLVGDVWLASGQSNMERTMSAFVGHPNVVDIDKVVADSANPQIRIFLVARKAVWTPQADVVSGGWKVCAPDVVRNSSAVAYFFGKTLQDTLHRPIGLIDSYWGGMPIKEFISREALQPIPELKGELAKSEAPREAWGALTDSQRASALADYDTKSKEWSAATDAPYQAAMKSWMADAATAKAAGQPAPPRPVEAPPRPASPEGELNKPSTIFNGMIYPLIPYAIEGALWYQGESDSNGSGELYNALLPALIGDWRARWGEGNFPFLVVALANFRAREPEPSDNPWVRVREAQIKTSEKVPDVALGSAIDIGEAGNIHPVDKFDLGRRLAAAALHVAYGEQVPWAGPTFAGETIEPGDIRVKFTHAGAGLVIGQSPWPADNAPEPTDHLVGFAIAGADQKWVWADAKIAGDDVVVSSPQVPTPVAVRYGWATNPAVNLYNKEGFPAVPFRTDDWPYVATPGK
jgi:sialate O-acetylesterase